jgi:hypothetical protein
VEKVASNHRALGCHCFRDLSPRILAYAFDICHSTKADVLLIM